LCSLPQNPQATRIGRPSVSAAITVCMRSVLHARQKSSSDSPALYDLVGAAMAEEAEYSGPAGRRVEIAPGAFHFQRFVSLDRQRALVDECRSLMDGPVPGYVPIVRGGGMMHVRMLCLGLHWNGKTYQYETHRSDFDGLAAPPLPGRFKAVAREAAEAAGMRLDADLCILNYYESPDGRMGLHQDKDEHERSIRAGLPVVSISLGETARFLFGGLRRRDPVETIALESGDVFVFGGAARLRYHGVSRTMPGSSPPSLALPGRFNLTLRQYDVDPVAS
jgi:alkylated DNA repair protein (DNA oxidative demethylase)